MIKELVEVLGCGSYRFDGSCVRARSDEARDREVD